MKWLLHIQCLLVFVVLFFNYTHSISQDRVKIDSLTKQVELTNNDSVKINLYQKLFWEYRRNDLGKALAFATQSFELSKSSNNLPGFAMGRYMMAIIIKEQGNYDEATDLLLKAMFDFQELKDTIKVITCLTDLGNLYYQQDEYEKALNYLEQAGNLVLFTNNNIKLGRIYNMMGSLFLAQNQFDKSLEYYNKSLELNEKEDFKLGMSVNYNNMGSVYIELEEYDKARIYYLKSLEIKNERNDAVGIAATLTNLGRVCFMEEKYDEAMTYHQQALAKYTEIGDQSGIAICLTNLADDNLELRNYARAIDFAQKAISITTNHHLKGSQTEAYRILSGSFAGMRKFEQAYEFQKLYKSSNDSIQNVEAVTQVSEMEAKFENEKKKKKIAELNAENERQVLILQKQRSQRNLMIGFTVFVLALLVILIRNYRNKQKINKKLEELNLIKSRFFANISHEFRTPLTLLLGPLEKLLKNPKQEEKELIRIMHRNASRLLMLDNQLLDLSKLEAGKLRLKVCNEDIIGVLKGMVMSFQSMAEKQNIDFQIHFPENQIEAFFDLDKLEKIVYNLLSNAMKFTPEMGKVKFEFSLISDRKKYPAKIRKTSGQIICISVSDTGQGINKEQQQFIFDRFYQVDSKTNRKFEGSGLGLSLSKELVELHHGLIELESSPGKGSTFRVYLPIDEKAYDSIEIVHGSIRNQTRETFELSGKVADIAEEKENKISEEQSTDLTNGKYQLLIVEDNPDMRRYIKDCFDNRYDILEANDGKKGVEATIKTLPDLVISDLMMPEMDGIELCKNLKSDVRTCHIPVILLTALASAEDRLRGLETGADDYLAKPFNRQELQTRAQNLIDQRKRLITQFSKSVRLEPGEIAITPVDELFVQKLISKIEKHLADPDLSIEALIEEANLSRSQLHRKLKALTGMSATEFIRSIRLKRAAQLMEQHFGSIAETTYAVGFNNLSYFSRCFQKQFNMTPKEYIDQF